MKKQYFYLLALLVFVTLYSCKESSSTSQSTPVESTGDTNLDQLSAKISKDPKNATLYKQRADYYISKEAYDEAILDLQATIHLDSLNPNHYHQLADVYMDYFQSRKSLRTMRDVLEIYPERIPSLLKQTEFLYILKQYDQALISIDKIAKIDGQNAEAAFMLGMILLEKGDKNGATSAFKKATTFDSQLTDAWLMLGNIYEKKDKPIAKSYYKNAIKTDPKNIQAMHAMAYYLQNHEEVQKAIDLYRDIILIDTRYEPAFLNTGILQLENKNYDKAIENFKILVSINPKSFLAYYFQGVCYEAKGDMKSARDNYQNCLNFNPDYEDAQIALNKLK